MKKRDLIFIVISLILLAAGMLTEKRLEASEYHFVEYLIYLAAYFLVGWKILVSAVRNIFKGKIFDENFLMSIATLGAIGIHQFEEAVGVMLFFKIGEFLEDSAVDKSLDSIESLLNIKPDCANVENGDSVKSIAPDDVSLGEILLVKPGEKIALDGEIISGSSSLEASMLTGESKPITAKPGDPVLAGMMNISGLLKIRVTKLFKDSSVSKIVEYTEKARLKKSETEKFITTFARYYSPAVVLLAACIAFIPPMIIKDALFSDWIYRALILLVISCPCALVISIPLSYFGGLGAASRRGILIKGSNYLDTLARTMTVVFDKTGTLTKGNFKMLKTVPQDWLTEAELLRYAAIAESNSNHPIAKAIIEACGKNGINGNDIVSHREIPGEGVAARLADMEILAGNDTLLHSEKIDHPQCVAEQTTVHISVNKRYAGHIIIGDEIKDDAADAITKLRNAGINNIIMLTGDNEDSAKHVASQIGIDDFYANLLPIDKHQKLEEIIEKNSDGNKTIFAGDGINDAPVLARADVGIAMGGLGADIAIDSADVVIMCDSPSKVAVAIKISRKTRELVRQNIFLALLVKAGFIMLGSVGYATMWEAVFADVGVTLLVVFNSLRLLKYNPK